MQDYREVKKKYDAFKALFSASSTTIEKLRSVRPMLSGISPRVDSLLEEFDKHLSVIEKVTEGDVILLGVEVLPETTEQEKRRKAALLLFLKSQKDLEGEMARVSTELEKNNGTHSVSTWGKIFGASKGPLGLVTILAVGAVLLQTTSVEVVIKNQGCGTLTPQVSIPVPLPGFSLPKEPILSGGSATATIPPLPLTVDGSQSGKLLFSSIGFHLTFSIGNARDVTFDGVSLIGKVTKLDLHKEKTHTLTLVCR